jgi:hypothetical protein
MQKSGPGKWAVNRLRHYRPRVDPESRPMRKLFQYRPYHYFRLADHSPRTSSSPSHNAVFGRCTNRLSWTVCTSFG